MDANFDIPYDKLDKIFSDFEIKSESQRTLSTLLNNLEAIEILERKTLPKFLIGVTVDCGVAINDVLAVGAQPWAGFIIGENVDIVSGQGKSIIPDAIISDLIATPPRRFPIFTPMVGKWSQLTWDGVLPGTLVESTMQGLLAGSMKVRVDKLIAAGTQHHFGYITSTQAVTFLLTILFAEGHFR